MDFWKVIEERYSVRQFDPEGEVSPDVVEHLLEAATLAPSAGNRQPWHFYVTRDPEIQQGLAAAAFGQQFVAEAPVVIVVCADAEQSAGRYGHRGRDLYCLQDTAVATGYILLAAVASGLGGCWVGAFDEGQATRILDLPRNHRPVAILPIGKPAGKPDHRTSREPVKNVATYLG